MTRSAAQTRLGVLGQAGLALACFSVLTLAERFFPLRPTRESKARHTARNLALAGLGAIVQSVEHSLTRRIAESPRRAYIKRRRALPSRAAHAAFGLLWLDYTLYLWHVLTHRIPFLWRFHAVHHADLDLDASTALRFHVVELTVSIPWRMAQVELFGISARALSRWQTALFLSVLFQHSNLRLPQRFERALAYLIVTPRLHGIHHSTRASERNSNWSSGLTVWDRFHGTFRDDVPQSEIEIGIPEARSSSQVTLGRMLLAEVEPREAQKNGARD